MTPDGGVLGGSPPPDPLQEVTHSAPAAQLLRHNLGALAREHEGTPLGSLLRDVLAERRPFQDLREDQDLMNIARQGVQDYRAHLATLAPDDRAALMAQAEVIAASEVG